ncbi:Bifunctional protein PutA [Halomonadaceae bacterium LMG 33818]|uniref:trifunctional transcriptional regulator/proline dehydrogenase/L-glutamate gamma-semialdehyde dehydrogenase n=1 Tax=Cernens ardua TaxID=3402176 RepID=UPI003EDBFA29
MANSTTMGVKLDQATRDRLKTAAHSLDRTPHWLIKQAIFNCLEQYERGQGFPVTADELTPSEDGDTIDEVQPQQHAPQPFLEFAESIQPQSVLRAAITSAYRRPEQEIVPTLVEQARIAPKQAKAVHELAYGLAERLRNQKSSGGRQGIVQGLLQEFSLSSQEGIALMCLAEALLRVPDKGTRDLLIRDKLSGGNWQSHLGRSQSLFVNAATWGLLITGKLTTTHNEAGLTSSLNRIIGKRGEPLIRKGVDMAMRLMGEQFVTGETIGEALANAGRYEAKGFRYSYDMLGEAAMTAKGADDYYNDYEQAIHAIGKASNGRGIYEGPGISIKLSALHPRYSRAQYDRVMDELYPRLKSLVLLAQEYDIGINIDAEEADRLELSLDLLEHLCFEPELEGWNGIGFVIQGYQKRCPLVIDYLIDLARRSRRRLMIRLVKGAYWDSEIKVAQVEGLEGYPVYTRKVYTDLSYISCARKLLAAPEAIYPQFATHNAYTLAAIYKLAGNNYYPGQYEFQCLHGMGEPLYEHVVGKNGLNRPCRIYAPCGSHETLLAYLVRRLLENGANTSFVNRIADHDISLDELVRDPVEEAEQMAEQEGAMGLPHPRIPLPIELYGDERVNSTGLDLSNEQRLASLSSALLYGASHPLEARPIVPFEYSHGATAAVENPSDTRDVVGLVEEATPEIVEKALAASVDAAPIWQATQPEERAEVLERAADLMEAQLQPLMGVLVREAGKTYANAIAEVREAVDFLRYYAAQAREHFDNHSHRPLGPVVCISPWNFPLAIFTGQIAAALVTGNTVLAKPAEQTPLIASEGARILIEAGLPEGVLQLLPGTGETVGAKLVGDDRIRGVMFTGSTEVARILARNLSGRLDSQGRPIPLIAETGGQNAMIVDSSALPEQVIPDVLASAFDSAGQRCSALRILCVQEDVAERVLDMLKGAMKECRLGNPEQLSSDIGPVIDNEARETINAHIEKMRSKGHKVHQISINDKEANEHGIFIPPTLIELDDLNELEREVFGPVLHIVTYKQKELGKLLDNINANGYGLTMGLHTRIDETIAQVIAKAEVGNLYVNRNIVGAVVGVQPFGGEGLSGTGPKAGGPIYLTRLLSVRPNGIPLSEKERTRIEPSTQPQYLARLNELAEWAKKEHNSVVADYCKTLETQALSGVTLELPGPTGERNTYSLLPRHHILCLATDPEDLLIQLAAVTAIGAKSIWEDTEETRKLHAKLPKNIRSRVELVSDWRQEGVAYDAVLYHGDSDTLLNVTQAVAARDGAIVNVFGMGNGETNVPIEHLLIEHALSINTAAAGGNASLMTIG